MATRHDKEARFRVQGNPELARKFVGEARKYLGMLLDAMRLGGIDSGHRETQNPQGVKFAVTKMMDDVPIIDIDVAEAKEEEAEVIPELLYIGSEGGMRVIDLNKREQVFSIDGLGTYEVDNVREDGGIIHLTGHGQAVRADLTTDPPTAFGGGTYPAIDFDDDGNPIPNCRAPVFEGKVSPDGTLLLLAFGTTVQLPSGTQITGLGGFQLADAVVYPLPPVRPNIRTCFRPYVGTWAPDSQHFFISSCFPYDSNGVPPQDPHAHESPEDYVLMFDRGGVLVSSRLVAVWDGDPHDIGIYAFHRRISSLVTNNAGTRLYALVENDPSAIGADPNTYLKVLDITTASMPIVATLTLGTHPSDSAFRLSISRDDTFMYALINNTYVPEDQSARMIGISIDGDTLAIASDTGDDFFLSSAMYGGIYNEAYSEVFRQGPANASIPAQDDRWFYFYKKEYEEPYPVTMYAYNDFAEEQVYSMDLKSYEVLRRYVIIFGEPYTRT